jgi:hypothetical protein
MFALQWVNVYFGNALLLKHYFIFSFLKNIPVSGNKKWQPCLY